MNVAFAASQGTTVADLLASYPDARPLVMGSGFSLFPDEGAMGRGGIFGTIRGALHCRGISGDLFTMLLTREVAPAAEAAP